MSLSPAEVEREILIKYNSGETQSSIASQYSIHQTRVSRIIKKHSKKLASPSGTASLVPAHLGCSQNYQNPYATHFFPNLMQPRMLYAQEGGRIAASPFAGQPIGALPVQCHSFMPAHGGWGQPCHPGLCVIPAEYNGAPFAAAVPFAGDASNASALSAKSIHRATHPSSQARPSPSAPATVVPQGISQYQQTAGPFSTMVEGMEDHEPVDTNPIADQTLMTDLAAEILDEVMLDKPSSNQSAIHSSLTSCKDAPEPCTDTRFSILDESLASRVRQRAKTPAGADSILTKLADCSLYSIDAVALMAEDIESWGFEAWECEIVRDDDETWSSKYSWLENFLLSFPDCLKDKRLFDPFLRAIQGEMILGREELLWRCPHLQIPLPIKSYIKNTLSNTAASASTQNFVGPSSPIVSRDAAGGSEGSEGSRGSGGLLPKSIDQPLEKVLGFINTAMGNIDSNIAGVSGSLRPKSFIKLLREGLNLMNEEYPTTSKPDFFDLGCGAGRALFGAAASRLFGKVSGIDLVQNQISLKHITEGFQLKSKVCENLKEFSEEFQAVQISWSNGCTEVGGSSFRSLFDGLSRSVLVYWFNVGWSREDIINSARNLSNIPHIQCIACVCRDQGSGACHLLAELNSSPGQKRFSTRSTIQHLTMIGKGSYTGYIFVRNKDFELDLQTIQLPELNQRVDVIWDNPLKWFSGRVTESNQESIRIVFDDGDSEDVTLPNVDVFLHPIKENQFKGKSLAVLPVHARCAVCEQRLSADLHISSFVCCTKCNQTTYHFDCLGIQRAPDDFVCFYCRAELAGLGRSQPPKVIWSGECSSCFGCGLHICKGPTKLEVDLCEFCKFPFGYCCTGRDSSTAIAYRCPACIGIASHDAVLQRCVAESARNITSIAEKCSLTMDERVLMDQFARAVSSLQDSCQWDCLDISLPAVMHQYMKQIKRNEDPSLVLFSAMNLLGMENGPDLDLFQKAFSVHVQKLSQSFRKTQEKNVSKARNKKLLKAKQKKGLNASKITLARGKCVARCTAREVGMRCGYVTADMRGRTPWWELSKVVLIEMAKRNTLFLFCRHEVSVDDELKNDPHYLVLSQHATIFEFDPDTSDLELAEEIRIHQLDLLMDAGGATYGSFIGVMSLRPAALQGAHLGYPGCQPGGHIDFTTVDQYVLPPDSPQMSMAEERLLYLTCYQPNALISCSDGVFNSKAPSTNRSDWNLPDSAFVFVFAGRSGRITRRLAKAFSAILLNVQNGVLWIRRSSQVAAQRILQFLLGSGVARKSIIFFDDVPCDEHLERLRHADLALDSDIYCGHTTCSDLYRAGVPYLVLVGDYFHGRVSLSLAKNFSADVDLICFDLEQFQRQAVYFGTEGREKLTSIRGHLNDGFEEGIFQGDKWIRQFQSGLEQFLRQMRSGNSLKDVYTDDRIPRSETREWVFAPSHAKDCPQSDRNDMLDAADVLNSFAQHLRGGEVDWSKVQAGQPCCANDYGTMAALKATSRGRNREEMSVQGVETLVTAKRSRVMNMADHSFATETLHAQVPPKSNGSGSGSTSEKDPDQSGSGCGDEPVSEQELGSSSDEESLFLQNLSECARRDPDRARQDAYDYLMRTMPTGREIAQYQRPDGGFTYAIQLPCVKDRISSETGRARASQTCFPLLYVSKAVGDRGSGLFSGQSFAMGSYMSMYDGVLLSREQVQDKTHVISLSYSLDQSVDSGRTPDHVLVEECSLGAKCNHAFQGSNVRFSPKEWKSPISKHSMTMFIIAKSAGERHTELTAYYRGNSAERDHNIPRRFVPEGRDLLCGAYPSYISGKVEACMQLLRKTEGWDLHAIRGAGSDGVAIEFGGHCQKFVVKMGCVHYTTHSRLSVLADAFFMTWAEDKRREMNVGYFSLSWSSESGWGPCGAALINVPGTTELLAAVAMQRADITAAAVWKELRHRFQKIGTSEDVELLRDLRNVMKGTIQVVKWAHDCGMVHGDLKPDNIFLLKLESIPETPDVAYCVVSKAVYQIILGDWGHARFLGPNGVAHTFSESGRRHSSTKFPDQLHDKVTVVKRGDLKEVFGARNRTNPLDFRHPGHGTVSIRAPNFNNNFQGIDQHQFDRAGDVWALGVMPVRVLAPLDTASDFDEKRKKDQAWAQELQNFSQREQKRSKACGSERAGQCLKSVQEPADRGSWIATMVRNRYASSSWPILEKCMRGQEGPEWMLLLGLLHGLLSHSSSSRFTASQALQHDFFAQALPNEQGLLQFNSGQ